MRTGYAEIDLHGHTIGVDYIVHDASYGRRDHGVPIEPDEPARVEATRAYIRGVDVTKRLCPQHWAEIEEQLEHYESDG